jgi:predicted enzyme related to lactoylglutathione lyase
MSVLVNIDVPDLESALAFYTQAFGLRVRRRLGEGAAELAGWPAPVFLLEKEAGSIGAGDQPRTYERHWTPVHLDVVVDHLEEAIARAVQAPWSSVMCAAQCGARSRYWPTRSATACA